VLFRARMKGAIPESIITTEAIHRQCYGFTALAALGRNDGASFSRVPGWAPPRRRP
jgi:hypothetical protein